MSLSFDARIQEIDDSPEVINAFALEEGWSDGLPVVPPTPDRVREALQYTDREPDEIIGQVPPGFGEASVERIAINSVLAGCDPSYLPVVIAAVEAVTDPSLNAQGIQATTNPASIMLLVNGPVARQLRINGSYNCLGQGWRANATIGRALRFILQNVGRALPGQMDRATHGQPAKFTLCCAENETENPWSPWHVERGFDPETSTVTAIGIAGTVNILSVTRDADEFLKVVADTLAFPGSNDYLRGGYPFIMFGPEPAAVLASAGLGKAEIKQRLWEQSRMAVSRFSTRDLERIQNARKDELGVFDSSTLIPISTEPDHINLVVAGGPGTHTVYLPTFGVTAPVIRPIVDSSGAPMQAFGQRFDQ